MKNPFRSEGDEHGREGEEPHMHLQRTQVPNLAAA